ncbi:MAG: glycosyltransferase [Rhizobiaceae bacterium]|nr:glycosyltransferase [Rhizobiaceae bacterium]
MTEGLVHVRTPTYRRPDALARCLRKLQAQTWDNWICTVYDDDAGRSAEAVCRDLNDPRIEYVHNDPQKFASKNIDYCFTADNPHGAGYFCVAEDDNYLLPSFMEENIAIIRKTGAQVVLRNQLVEHAAGTPDARVGTVGVLDGLFREGPYDAESFRLVLMMGIGVSNGGLFWSGEASSDLEIGHPCTATLQEYLRTFAINEPIYVAMEPLAVWAENAEQTTRNAELRSGYIRRELNLKKSIQKLQRIVWCDALPTARRNYLTNPLFMPSIEERARSIAKAIPLHRHGRNLPLLDRIELTARGWAIRMLGKTTGEFDRFVAERKARQRLASHPSVSDAR